MSGILPEDYSVKLEYVRLSVGVKVSPQQSEVRPVAGAVSRKDPVNYRARKAILETMIRLL